MEKACTGFRLRPPFSTAETAEQRHAIRSIPENGCAPLAINGHPLHAISYLSPVASAQVKSCVLLAGLYADGKTSVTEPALSRNHTELMLKFFGADVASEGLTASVLPDPDLHGNLFHIRLILGRH